MHVSGDRAVVFAAARFGVLAALMVAACSDGPTESGPAVASVQVDPSTASVQVGAAIPLAATVTGENGGVLTGRSVVWSSSDDQIASVNASGLVTGHRVGNVQIAASAGGESGIANIQVTRLPVASVIVSPDRSTVQVGQSQTLSVTARDGQGNLVTDRPATWSSSNANVATVSSAGVVTARASGSATIFAVVEGVTGSAVIDVPVVNASVARVQVQPSSATLEEDEELQLIAILFDDRNNVLTGRQVTWSTSDNKKCTVTTSGRVRARDDEGTCVVTATSEGKQGQSTIRLEDD